MSDTWARDPGDLDWVAGLHAVAYADEFGKPGPDRVRAWAAEDYVRALLIVEANRGIERRRAAIAQAKRALADARKRGGP